MDTVETVDTVDTVETVDTVDTVHREVLNYTTTFQLVSPFS